MSKMRYFNNKFSKFSKRWGSPLRFPLGALRPALHWELSAASVPLTSDFGDLKLRDLPKLWFFKWIMTKSKFKKSVITSFQ